MHRDSDMIRRESSWQPAAARPTSRWRGLPQAQPRGLHDYDVRRSISREDRESTDAWAGIVVSGSVVAALVMSIIQVMTRVAG